MDGWERLHCCRHIETCVLRSPCKDLQRESWNRNEINTYSYEGEKINLTSHCLASPSVSFSSPDVAQHGTPNSQVLQSCMLTRSLSNRHLLHASSAYLVRMVAR